ncbi:MAG: acyl-CoA dehydrogenase [Cytophagaceae bacterium]|nr:MAG: acyl-CoA dehydrogenase [Cytophagaceae bacterium]
MTSEIVENQVDTVQLIRESVREFALRHLAPHVREWDERQHFPADEFREMGSLGLLGMLVPETYGGAGLGYHEYVAAIVELSKVDGAVGLSMAAHNSLCTNHILMFGTEEQKQKYLPKLASGEHIGAWGLTEPNTGSDAGNMRTRAVQQENGDWLLNGAKNFITHGRSGNVAVVIARTGEPNTPRNATAFVVERGTDGFRGGKKEDKLGMRASETAEMIFEDCRIPDSQRLGEVGGGFVQSLKILDGGRISIAALSLGIAMGAYEAALAYAQERQQFGQSIFNFQGISFKLADMATDIEASRLLIEHASELKNQHKPVTKASAMAKLFASEVSVRVANEAVQILGGYGYIKDFPVEKFYRDAKLCTIGEGTSEIQKVVIARHIM